MTSLKFKRLGSHTLPLPSYESEGAAGMDLRAASEVKIEPDGRALVPTGWSVSIPEGFYGQIASRSGLALKRGIFTLGGVIDSDYRGEVGVILINTGSLGVWIEPGDRIAQLIILPVPRLPVEEAEGLSETVRGEGGFGSSGVK